MKRLRRQDHEAWLQKRDSLVAAGQIIEDEIFGQLVRCCEDGDEDVYGDVAFVPGNPVSVGIAIKRDDEDQTVGITERLVRARRLFQYIRAQEHEIRSTAARELCQVIERDQNATARTMRLDSIYFFLEGHAQLVYDVSGLRLARDEMFVDVNAAGRIQDWVYSE